MRATTGSFMFYRHSHTHTSNQPQTAFAVGALTNIPALQQFCLVAALAVLADFLLQVRLWKPTHKHSHPRGLAWLTPPFPFLLARIHPCTILHTYRSRGLSPAWPSTPAASTPTGTTAAPASCGPRRKGIEETRAGCRSGGQRRRRRMEMGKARRKRRKGGGGVCGGRRRASSAASSTGACAPERPLVCVPLPPPANPCTHTNGPHPAGTTSPHSSPPGARPWSSSSAPPSWPVASTDSRPSRCVLCTLY